MKVLHLPIKGVYFHQIASGAKTEEYRLYTDFWSKRIEGKNFDCIKLTLGYPKADDAERIILKRWKGYKVKTITHPHFGDYPVKVFAIDVTGELNHD